MISHSSPLGATTGARPSIKNELDSVFSKLHEYDDAISRIDVVLDRNATLADDAIKASQSSLKTQLAALRDEVQRQFRAMALEIAAVQKAVSVQRGEQAILAQQQKDCLKKVEGVASLTQDLLGEVSALSRVRAWAYHDA